MSTAYELGFASAAVIGKIVTLAFCAFEHKVLTMGAYLGSGKEESERPFLNLHFFCIDFHINSYFLDG